MQPHPWDSPGKNTGVGCHFLRQCIEVKSESEVVQLCPTFRDPMDCSLPGSFVHGIFQARVLEWGAIAFSNPGHLVTHKIKHSHKILISQLLLPLSAPQTEKQNDFGVAYPELKPCRISNE